MHMFTDAEQTARVELRQADHPASQPMASPRRAPVRNGAVGAVGGEYLTFRLGQEHYGIDILRVQEIRSYEPPTRIANSPSFFKGVLNLRGVIVPIIDLRLKLGVASADYNAFTVVIVLNVRDRLMGAVVDSVSDVLALAGSQIQPAPDLLDTMDAPYIKGMASVAERLLILMDIESLMTSADTAFDKRAGSPRHRRVSQQVSHPVRVLAGGPQGEPGPSRFVEALPSPTARACKAWRWAAAPPPPRTGIESA